MDGNIRQDFLDMIKNDVEATRIDLRDAVIRIYVNKGEEKIARVVDSFTRKGIKIRQISLKEPTLDDVFFYYTGRSLWVMETEGRSQSSLTNDNMGC